ncbi:MAG: PEP-CTERM system histidine kinase PrsK [Alteromonadaceae bacterium]|nr:PEP-CTERM system histidine kinase PrsK [Alteromonadaceae bacterium]
MELLGLSGYIFASIAYFLFILLLLAARNRTVSGALVLLGSLVTLASFTAGAFQLEQHFSIKIIFVLENIKFLFWSLIILATRERIQTINDLFINKYIRQYFLVWMAISFVTWFSVIYLQSAAKLLFMLFLILNLWSLVLLEQLYRNAELQSKRALKPLVIALGAVFIFDFIMFAQASMLNQLDFYLWYIRPIVGAVSVPFLLISTRRMKDWSVNVFISRDVVFYSSMLLISGAYLLVMAFAGYVINYFGGEWGNNLSVAFLVMGCIVLAALLITESLRREVKVFITKHFFANKYDYRFEWLKLIEQLEISKSGDYYKTALNIIRSTLNISEGIIIKKENMGRYNVVYSEGIISEQALFYQLQNIDQFCQKNKWIIDIREYDKVENSYPDLTIDSNVFAEINISIIVPILMGEVLYGFFLLSSPAAGNRLLNWEDRDLLSAISKQLSHYLSLNEANDKLAESKQFDTFNRMSAFLVHDLKNVQAQLTLISSNAKKHRDNPEFVDDAFETIESATARLGKVLTQLRNKTVVEAEHKKTNLNEIFEKVVAQRNMELPEVELSLDQSIEMKLEHETFSSMINHLIQNAQEATREDGWVKIKVSLFDDCLSIEITDNGCGMSKTFIRERLFKPFDTTKGNAGMGIGVFEAKQFIEGLEGSIHVTSTEGKGTSFHLSIPTLTDID